MRINTNVSSLVAQDAAQNTNKTLTSSLEKLSTGLRINKASDDASGLAIADKLRTQATSINQGIANGNSAVSLLQIADKSMSEQSNILDTVKAKLIQANTDTTSADGREAIRKDIAKLLEQLDNIAEQTNYNGNTLLQASALSQKDSISLSFQIGETNNDIIGNKSIQSNTQGLGLAASKETATKITAQNEQTYSLDIGGNKVSYTSDKTATVEEINAGLKAAVQNNVAASALVDVLKQTDPSNFVLKAVDQNTNVDITSSNTAATMAIDATKDVTGTAGTAKAITFEFSGATATTASIQIGSDTAISVAFNTDAATTANDLMNAINASSTTNFTATRIGTTLKLLQDKNTGDVPITAVANGALAASSLHTPGVAGTKAEQSADFTVKDNTKYSVTINNETISFTTGTGATSSNITSGLRDALSSNTALQSGSPLAADYIISSNADNTLTITAANVGEGSINASVSVESDSGKISTAVPARTPATAATNAITASNMGVLTLATDTASITVNGDVYTVTGTEAGGAGATGKQVLAALNTKINAATGKDYNSKVDPTSGNLTISNTTLGNNPLDVSALKTTTVGAVSPVADVTTDGVDSTATSQTSTITAADNTTYKMAIGSESISYTSGSAATVAQITEGLKAAFDANENLSTTADTGFTLEVTGGAIKITENAPAATAGNLINAGTNDNSTSALTTKTTVEAGTGESLAGLKNLAVGSLTAELANTFQAVVDDAITDLNGYRGDVGSTQNQVESAVRNLMTQATNVKAAESIIRDVDYAQESANFNKQNIISQAGAYAISQANSVQQNVLKLLQ